jgi:hypothetical protein
MEEKIKELFKANKLFYSWYIISSNLVEIYVDCGDWKHDHLFLQNLMTSNGFQFIGKEVDEEDEDNGDDSFSATHTYLYIETN